METDKQNERNLEPCKTHKLRQIYKKSVVSDSSRKAFTFHLLHSLRFHGYKTLSYAPLHLTGNRNIHEP